jgi:hypothetical protein
MSKPKFTVQGAEVLVIDLDNLVAGNSEMNKLMFPVNWRFKTPFVYFSKPYPKNLTTEQNLLHFDKEIENIIKGLTEIRRRIKVELNEAKNASENAS